MSMRRRREEPEGGEPPAMVIRIDPKAVEETLFREFHYQMEVDEKEGLPEDAEAIKGVPSKIAGLIQVLTRHYFSSVLGGKIISPHFGKDILIDRAIQFTEILFSIHTQRIADLVKKIEEKRIRGEDFENEIRELLQYPETAFITVRELINRLLTALHINLPPELRPPLVNLKVGYDVVE